METKKVLSIIFSLLFVGAFAFVLVWGITNFNKVQEGLSGTGLYTQEDLNKAYEDGYDKALTDKAEYEELINSYRDTITTLTDQVTLLTYANQDCETQIKNLTETKQGLETQVANLTSIKKQNEATITSLNEDLRLLLTETVDIDLRVLNGFLLLGFILFAKSKSQIIRGREIAGRFTQDNIEEIAVNTDTLARDRNDILNQLTKIKNIYCPQKVDH